MHTINTVSTIHLGTEVQPKFFSLDTLFFNAVNLLPLLVLIFAYVISDIFFIHGFIVIFCVSHFNDILKL